MWHLFWAVLDIHIPHFSIPPCFIPKMALRVSLPLSIFLWYNFKEKFVYSNKHNFLSLSLSITRYSNANEHYLSLPRRISISLVFSSVYSAWINTGNIISDSDTVFTMCICFLMPFHEGVTSRIQKLVFFLQANRIHSLLSSRWHFFLKRSQLYRQVQWLSNAWWQNYICCVHWVG